MAFFIDLHSSNIKTMKREHILLILILTFVCFNYYYYAVRHSSLKLFYLDNTTAIIFEEQRNGSIILGENICNGSSRISAKEEEEILHLKNISLIVNTSELAVAVRQEEDLNYMIADTTNETEHASGHYANNNTNSHINNISATTMTNTTTKTATHSNNLMLLSNSQHEHTTLELFPL